MRNSEELDKDLLQIFTDTSYFLGVTHNLITYDNLRPEHMWTEPVSQISSLSRIFSIESTIVATRANTYTFARRHV